MTDVTQSAQDAIPDDRTNSSLHDPGAMAEALTEAAEILTAEEMDFAEAVRGLSARLHHVAHSATIARIIFRLALLEGSPLRARFAAQVLMAHGHNWMASLLVARGLQSGAKAWEKRNLRALLEGKPRQPEVKNGRISARIGIHEGTVRIPGTSAEAEETIAEIGAPDQWLASLAALLEVGEAGIHLDVIEVEVTGGGRAVPGVLRLLEVGQLLPVTFAVVVDDIAAVAELVGSIPLAVRQRTNPVIALRTEGEGFHLITAGGGSLYEIGDISDLRLADRDRLVSLALATALVAVYESEALATHRAMVVESFREEASSVLPLQSNGGYVERALRYRGTMGETMSLRHALTGHLIGAGYFGEALALLEVVPKGARDRIHTARTLRALYGRGRFEDVPAIADGKKLSPPEQAIVTEAAAVKSLLGLLTEVDDSPQEELDPIDGKVVSILHASVPEQSGGYAVRAHSVLQELVKQGFEVTPYTRPGFPEHSNGLAPGEILSEEQDNLVYRRIGSKASRAQGEYAYMLESVDHYKKVLRNERPAAVHLRSTYVSALPGLIAAKYFGIPAVYEVSGMWELVYEAANDARMEGRRARTVILEDAVLEAVESVCTITAAMGRIIDARATLRQPLRLVPNAVDVESFSESPKDDGLLAELGWQNSTPVIGYIGSFVDYEGLDLLIRALAVLRDRGVDHRALLVGDGASRPSIQALAGELGLAPETHRFTGRVPHEEVAKLYSLVDVCAYPRRLTPATEAVSPLKPFEAMASGKTVIVSDVPALVEIAGDGARAQVVPEGDHLALADSLQFSLVNPDHAAAMRSRAQQWVRRERSWETVGGLLATQIQDVVAGQAAVGMADGSSGSGI